MKQILIYAIILSFVIISCRTSSRTVEKQHESVDSLFIQKKEIELKNDSVFQKNIYGLSENHILNLLSKINFQFSGNSANDSAQIEIIQTKNGIKLNVSGKANADLITDAVGNTETKDSTRSEFLQVQQTKSENINEKTQVKVDKSKIDKKSEVKSKSVPFWIYLFGFLLLVVIVALYWLFGRPKK